MTNENRSLFEHWLEHGTPVQRDHARRALARFQGGIVESALQPEGKGIWAAGVRKLNLMKACDYRLSESDCGCGGLARCLLGKGRDSLVNHFDCFDCLTWEPKRK